MAAQGLVLECLEEHVGVQEAEHWQISPRQVGEAAHAIVTLQAPVTVPWSGEEAPQTFHRA